tara:strand:- start:140 stop:1051 length:912 start_codon:yes stop_codon:yes gene_type:complete
MKIENINDFNKSELIQAINDHWKQNHILFKNSKIFDLQHKHDNGYSFLTLRENNQIKSFLGYIYSNSNKNSFWLAIWKSIDSGIGGLYLLLYLNQNNPEFIGAIGISEFTKNITRKLGWTLGVMSHYYISTENILNLKSLNSTSTNEQFYEFNDEIDLASLKLNLEIMPYKDRMYYEKRFLKHPVFKYKYLSINSLIFIGRIVEYQDLKVFHVVDVIGDLKNVKLKSPLSHFLKKEKIDLFEMMYYDSRQIKIDLFLKLSNDIIPTYFDPFELKNINIELTYKANTELPVRFFLGDGDQDRPN